MFWGVCIIHVWDFWWQSEYSLLSSLILSPTTVTGGSQQIDFQALQTEKLWNSQIKCLRDVPMELIWKELKPLSGVHENAWELHRHRIISNQGGLQISNLLKAKEAHAHIKTAPISGSPMEEALHQPWSPIPRRGGSLSMKPMTVFVNFCSLGCYQYTEGTRSSLGLSGPATTVDIHISQLSSCQTEFRSKDQ